MSARSSNQAGTADECDLSPRTPKWYSINSSAVSMVYGALGLFSYWYFIDSASVSNTIGFLLPAVRSFKAIESPIREDHTAWLMYWIVFASFNVVEYFTTTLLTIFPFYYLAKCVVLIWCMLPNPWNGSALLYKIFVKPFCKRTQEAAADLGQDLKDSSIMESIKVPQQSTVSAAPSQESKSQGSVKSQQSNPKPADSTSIRSVGAESGKSAVSSVQNSVRSANPVEEEPNKEDAVSLKSNVLESLSLHAREPSQKSLTSKSANSLDAATEPIQADDDKPAEEEEEEEE